MTVLYIFLAILSLLAVLFLIYALVLVFPGFKKERLKDFEGLFTDYAHRGLWGDGIPENSLAAFKKARDKGFGMELDVRLSKDNVVMVLHDDILKRVTGAEGKLSELTAEEITKLRLLGTGEGIPRFADVLNEVDGQVPIMVELKGENRDTRVCYQADRLLRDYKGPYCIESFNPFFVGWYRKKRPEVMRGQLVDGRTNPLSAVCSALVFNIYNRPDFISFKFDRYNRFALWLATRFWGAKRFTWTIKTEKDRKAALEDGSSVIFEGFTPDEKV